MASPIPETAPKLLIPETLRSAAKQSKRIHIIPLRLLRAIGRFVREQKMAHMRRKVLCLSESFSDIKDVNLQLLASTSKQLLEDPLKSMERSKRWKIKTSYGDVGLTYRDDETVAYVASRMPAVYSAFHRVVREVRRRPPDFSLAKVLDLALVRALCEVWSPSLERANLIEPSKTMQCTVQSLLQGLKDLPLIQSYDSIQSLSQSIGKADWEHDLVVAGEHGYLLLHCPLSRSESLLQRSAAEERCPAK